MVRIGTRFDGVGWERPVCGDWTAAETVRHLVGVAGWYHAWLDRALLGEMAPPFSPSAMDSENARELADRSGLAAAEAIVAFEKSADEYVERAMPEWDRPFAFPFGLVTVGQHLGIAAVEWNLHAWDLSTVRGPQHVPSDPRGLFLAAGAGVAAAEGGVKGVVLTRLVPIAAGRNPWKVILRRSGRTT